MIGAFDLDGTLLRKNSSFAFCCYLYENRILSPIDITYCITRYLQHHLFNLSLWNLQKSVFDRLFFGKKVQDLSPYLESFIQEKLPSLWYPPGLQCLRNFQERGDEVMILSNSPRLIVQPIAKHLGVEKVLATEYQIDKEGKLCDIATLVDGNTKADELCFLEKATAFSDSHLDLPFLKKAHEAIAVNPTRKLKKIAKAQGWEIL